MFRSEKTLLIKVNIPVYSADFINDIGYIGFVQFTKQKCGKKFLHSMFAWNNSTEDYEINVDFLDYESIYHNQYRWLREEGRHSAVAFQFYREISQKDDLGTTKKDSFFMMINDIDLINFDSGFDIESCISGLFVGAMTTNHEITGGIEANLAACATEDKDFGWLGPG